MIVECFCPHFVPQDMTFAINSFQIFIYFINVYFLLRNISMKYFFLNVKTSFWKIYVLNYSRYNNFLCILLQ